MSVFADRLKQVRKENNVTQAELAKVVNKSRVTVTAYETDSRLPDIETTAAIADFFNEDINWLLGRTDIRVSSADIPDEVLMLAESYSRLTSDEKKLVKALIDSLANKVIK